MGLWVLWEEMNFWYTVKYFCQEFGPLCVVGSMGFCWLSKQHSLLTSSFPIRGIPHLAKPTPLLVPLVSRRIRVEITWPKGFSIPSNSCSSIDSGRLDMYKFVGSCSCCYENKSEKMKLTSLIPLPFSALIHKMTSQTRDNRKGATEMRILTTIYNT